MKIRDSGMPEEPMWSGFFDPPRVLERLGFSDPQAGVVDLGCGYGTFSLAAAARTSGPVHAFDIEGEMVALTARKAHELGLSNVRARRRDFVAEGTGMPEASVAYAMLFNVLHAERPVDLLREARRILMPGGLAAVMHWIPDAATPRGPDLSIRPTPGQCRAWLTQAEFTLVLSEVALPPYHFGVVGQKPL